VQEEYSRLRNEFVKYRRDAETHWRILSVSQSVCMLHSKTLPVS
jgi:hypothetical protein